MARHIHQPCLFTTNHTGLVRFESVNESNVHVRSNLGSVSFLQRRQPFHEEVQDFGCFVHVLIKQAIKHVLFSWHFPRNLAPPKLSRLHAWPLLKFAGRATELLAGRCEVECRAIQIAVHQTHPTLCSGATNKAGAPGGNAALCLERMDTELHRFRR